MRPAAAALLLVPAVLGSLPKVNNTDRASVRIDVINYAERRYTLMLHVTKVLKKKKKV